MRGDLLPTLSLERREGVGGRARGWSGDLGGGVFALSTLKNGECQNEIKKMWKERAGERGKWVKVRVDDRVKNEEGEENPV